MPADDEQLTHDLASLRIDREPERSGARSGSRSGSGARSRVGRRIIWLAVFLMLGGIAGFVVMSGRASRIVRGLKERLVAPEVRLAQVSLVSPSQSDVTLVATGYVVSRRKATLAPKIGGRIARLYFGEGSRVREGQVVAELERSDAEAQLAQARADVASAHAKVAQVRADLADVENKARREGTLLGKGAGTAAASQDAQARVNVVRAQLAATRADEDALGRRIRTVQVQLENSRVRAPFDSTILRKLAEVGEVVSPTPAGGLGGIFLVAALDQLEVEADVAESQLGKILTAPDGGAAAQGTAFASPAEIVLDAFPNRRFRGAVSEVRPTVDRAKATVTVKVRFVDSSDGVLPDMGAKVSFLSRPIEASALREAPKRVVPTDAITERDGRTVVLVVDSDVIKVVPVKVKGPAGAGQSEIGDEPPPGAQVVRAPAPELTAGMKVKHPEG